MYRSYLTKVKGIKRLTNSRSQHFSRNTTGEYISNFLKPYAAARISNYHSIYYLELGLGHFANGGYQTMYVSLDREVVSCGHNVKVVDNVSLKAHRILREDHLELIVRQLGSRGNHQFSYCFQDPQGRESNYLPMFLRFGDDIERLPDMSVTPLFTVNSHPYYVLVQNDISVNGVNMNIPDHLFRTNPDYSGETIIDSSSALSYLVPDAFCIVLKAISSHMRHRNPHLRKSSIPIPGVSACWEPLYDFPVVDLPSLTYHLKDADLYIDPFEMMTIFQYQGVHDPNLHCLTVAKTEASSPNMIGAYHQINKRLMYDVGNSKLFFAKDSCATRG